MVTIINKCWSVVLNYKNRGKHLLFAYNILWRRDKRSNILSVPHRILQITQTVHRDMKATAVEPSLNCRDAAHRQGAYLRGWLVFGAGFVQDRYLGDRAAFSEQCTPSFTNAQVTLCLPLPKSLLQFCLYLNTHISMNKKTESFEFTFTVHLQISAHYGGSKLPKIKIIHEINKGNRK